MATSPSQTTLIRVPLPTPPPTKNNSIAHSPHHLHTQRHHHQHQPKHQRRQPHQQPTPPLPLPPARPPPVTPPTVGATHQRRILHHTYIQNLQQHQQTPHQRHHPPPEDDDQQQQESQPLTPTTAQRPPATGPTPRGSAYADPPSVSPRTREDISLDELTTTTLPPPHPRRQHHCQNTQPGRHWDRRPWHHLHSPAPPPPHARPGA